MEKNFSPKEKTSKPSLENLRVIEEKNLLVVEETFSEIKRINERIIAILKEKNGRKENLQDQDDELNTLSLSSKELMTKLEKALKTKSRFIFDFLFILRIYFSASASEANSGLISSLS